MVVVLSKSAAGCRASISCAIPSQKSPMDMTRSVNVVLGRSGTYWHTTQKAGSRERLGPDAYKWRTMRRSKLSERNAAKEWLRKREPQPVSIAARPIDGGFHACARVAREPRKTPSRTMVPRRLGSRGRTVTAMRTGMLLPLTRSEAR